MQLIDIQNLLKKFKKDLNYVNIFNAYKYVATSNKTVKKKLIVYH